MIVIRLSCFMLLIWIALFADTKYNGFGGEKKKKNDTRIRWLWKKKQFNAKKRKENQFIQNVLWICRWCCGQWYNPIKTIADGNSVDFCLQFTIVENRFIEWKNGHFVSPFDNNNWKVCFRSDWRDITIARSYSARIIIII